ncbi:phage tail assembly chaperone [Agrobacterium larrymoorei]|uniref:rcc01693 family protein n=1 Tax=Agrobacterium larrymoorei TaxID=160699 RepID=UPI0015745EE4|nr:rcc01693 family protein [Agrobacterium larrymoorei]NTJ41714.1 phage tail assembly chaperone [Agrobacterium larrymoorei]
MRAAAGAGRSQENRPFPWGQVIHAGLCLLRLSPTVFWALTPVEFFAMTGGMRPRAPGLSRAGLDELMRAFPDG